MTGEFFGSKCSVDDLSNAYCSEIRIIGFVFPKTLAEFLGPQNSVFGIQKLAGNNRRSTANLGNQKLCKWFPEFAAKITNFSWSFPWGRTMSGFSPLRNRSNVGTLFFFVSLIEKIYVLSKEICILLIFFCNPYPTLCIKQSKVISNNFFYYN